MAVVNGVVSLILYVKKCSYQWNDETLCKFQEISTQNCILGRWRTLLLNSLMLITKNTELLHQLECLSSDIIHQRDTHLLKLLDNVLVFVQERFICSVDTWDEQSFSYFTLTNAELYLFFCFWKFTVRGLSVIQTLTEGNTKTKYFWFLEYWIKPTWIQTWMNSW